MLSDSDSDGEAVQQLTINEHFAKVYAHKKEREELSKLKEKYGSDEGELEEEEEDSEDTEEDEDGEELTPAVDAAILRTLARIRRKDPEIYESGKAVFEEEQHRSKGSFNFAQKEREKDKPLLLRQHILHSNLNPSSRSPSPELAGPTHVEEQTALRKETIRAFHSAVAGPSTSSEDEDDLLIPREKTKDELEQEEEEYRDFLTREVGEDISKLVTLDKTESEGVDVEENTEKGHNEKDGFDVNEISTVSKKKSKSKKKRSKEVEDHEFLMNYILNRGWVDKSSRHVPTFDEITSSKPKRNSKSKDSGAGDNVEGDAGENEDGFDEDEFDDMAETFESSYNFRFEEPNAATIPAYPRELSNTVRREENPRKAARERKKERQEEQMVQKREEIKRLKALKMKELREKLERIGREGGKDADDEALAQFDLDGDWDPEAHDKQMAGVYGENEAYAEEIEDMEKPTWDDDINIDDILQDDTPKAGPSKLSKKERKKLKKKLKKAKGDIDDNDNDDDDDGDGNGVDIDEMDADYVPNDPRSREEITEALDSLNSLEFNSIIGSGDSALPTRFKYVPVLPSTYGLSSVEILLADDTDLNEVVGLKKLAPYRRDGGRAWDSRRGEKLREFRKNLGHKKPGYYHQSSTTGQGSSAATNGESADGGGQVNLKKRKGKKERQKEKMAIVEEEESNDTVIQKISTDVNEEEPPMKKRKRRHKKTSTTS